MRVKLLPNVSVGYSVITTNYDPCLDVFLYDNRTIHYKYVIDGFLDNNTILAIKEHTTDTEGYTEHIFALCFSAGIRCKGL